MLIIKETMKPTTLNFAGFQPRMKHQRSKFQLNTRTLEILFVLWLSICSLVLHNSVFNSIYPSELRETQPLAESRGEHHSFDSHVIEDDMAFLENKPSCFKIGLVPRDWETQLSTLSHTQDPLIPPPKVS